MNRKALLIVAIVVILAIALAGFYFYKKSQPKAFANEMSGKIVALKDNIITVEGYLNLSGQAQKIKVDFLIDSQTKFNKTVLDVSGNHPAGEFFEPKIVKTAGAASDLGVNVRINSIKSAQNLVGASSAKAQEINYGLIENAK